MVDPESKPLVTFIVLCYNQVEHLRQAIQAAFGQTYSPLEILVSDDGSTDGSSNLIADMVSAYRGPHHVRCNLNKTNLGISRHISRVFELSNGQLNVIAAADDISLPQRTERTVQCWLSSERRASAIFCNALELQDGDRAGPRHRVALGKEPVTTKAIVRYARGGPVLLGACAAYTPDVMTAFGDMLPDLLVEDIPLAVRASMLSGVLCIDEDLVLYRTGTSVWVPRKLQHESFEKHLRRLSRRAIANHSVARQILLDVTGSGEAGLIDAAERRLLAHEYLVMTKRSRRFLASRFFHALRTSTRWQQPLALAFLFAFPMLHRSLFQVHQWLGRLRRHGHE